jgi:hypothetical protein
VVEKIDQKNHASLKSEFFKSVRRVHLVTGHRKDFVSENHENVSKNQLIFDQL